MKSLKIKAVLTLLIAVIFIQDCFSQGSGNKYAGEFLAVGVGGRPKGMGGAYVALVSDVTAGYWNPGSLSKINYPQFSLMHDAMFGNLINYDYGSVGIPFGPSASFGLSMVRMGIDDISDTRNALIDLNGNGILDPGERLDPDKITKFSSADYAVYLTYSKKQSEKFSYGANFKVIRKTIADDGAWGLGIDIGARYNPFGDFYLGANLQDITTTYLSWSTGKNEVITPTAKLGTAYQFEFLNGRFSPAVDFDLRFENRKSSANANVGPVSLDVHAGLEYTFKDIVSIRTGYNELGNYTLGAGVKLPKINIDYSFSKFDGLEELGNSHVLSLTFTLEEEKFQRK
ncbi:MAG TPA: PorV/PorQ family protein [Ignavibacteria bacterium]|nr:PorV/PorQ family protein [Ignavibacteria bacterium]